MVRCWLDIDIGDAAQYALESRAFARAQALFDTIKSQGTMQATPPTPLRAGRLTIELFTEAAPRACDGSGGDSIYGKPFNDEKGGLKLKHDAAGIVSMANSGKNSNTSQFFLTLGPAPACDGKHTVFGRVVEGLPILQRIDALAASKDGDPLTDVCISDSGYDG
ncbi:Peptidyl-prolyl cis-trans isomerase cypE [Auxenochlorella protothecoides]|uniref:Peptidyl-prolyl cis-trans isomerase cypE n=1 Tax=Auxenochlorella protothecoides TaxID=3075 RepID=A0A087SD26_AUXPR|nr:Peptidyl-prolyl cis-trans isomerase cypE [Auxenochlorella protothecoides]KFM23630.1 Peptidyl-prolyl cis-trans isomerase cypE [Auxenochlorella protothecoides]RMZ52047.1 hypothetical protein APUTEX25_001241 [Auxenochlorella protothecoides]|eukprot:RMZ52047.1 hypothetical protein APUTEX25_001241 [Auxenochlorella protothecoides]